MTGTVVIDGPQLVLEVGGPATGGKVTLTKLVGNTWTYKYTATVNKNAGGVNFTITARTVFTGGQKAGQTHTSALPVKQSDTVYTINYYDTSGNVQVHTGYVLAGNLPINDYQVDISDPHQAHDGMGWYVKDSGTPFWFNNPTSSNIDLMPWMQYVN